ncbi:hypothetical protein NPX13_g3141 [Xylaria arbuscula]|uniref:Uncharacterized protein n=1 Tax=Xylaria arbuscula TaxID=114810 RepID=A0A9W8NIS5_9PEZI|nr:hypothetical protein NPX13_g3141 [Xylaria arbuscula]
MATTAYTPDSGEPGIWLRFPKTEPTYENCFGKEYFRFFLYSCSTEVTGWSIIRNLELTALDLATLCHELLSEQRQKWQTQRPSGSPYHAEWSLKCLLMGPRRSQASPHVVIFTTDASLGEKIIDIIRKSGLFKDFPGWTCISLWSSIIDRTTASNLFNSPFFSLSPLTQSQRHIYLDMLWPKTSSYTLIDDARVSEQDTYFDYFDQDGNPAAAQNHVFAKFDDFFFIISALKGYWSQMSEEKQRFVDKRKIIMSTFHILTGFAAEIRWYPWNRLYIFKAMKSAAQMMSTGAVNEPQLLQPSTTPLSPPGSKLPLPFLRLTLHYC